MTLNEVPWIEITVALPMVGAAVSVLFSQPMRGWRWALIISVLTFLASAMPWATSGASNSPNGTIFRIDQLSAPLLPLVALLHVLVILATAKVKMNRMSFVGHLIGESIRLATFACPGGWALVLLLILGTVPPLWELLGRGKGIRVYVIHMSLFAIFLVVGWSGTQIGSTWAPMLVLTALMIRCGTVPGHLWTADLVENASFGTGVLFVAPVTGAYAVARLVLPFAPDWALQGLGVASLITALYGAGMATVQDEGRRLFSYLTISHSAMVLIGLVELVGLEPMSAALSLTGALCLWVAAVLSLTGLGITLRAIEARVGRLDFTQFRGLYDQSPALAVSFAISGLAAVGFPGTLGFLASELLIDGAVETNLTVGLVLVATAALNGIAVLRAYLGLFTGARHASAVPLAITRRERFAVLLLALMLLGGGLAPQAGMKNRHEAAVDLMSQRHAGQSQRHTEK